MTDTPRIAFHLAFPFTLRNRRKLKEAIAGLMRSENKKFLTLNYIFCSDSFLLNINRQFLQHNDFTDIITFNLAAPGHPSEGEIYISIERVKENAAVFGAPFTTELRRVMIHGALHLCGHKDKTPAQKQEMRKKEDFYLTKFPV